MILFLIFLITLFLLFFVSKNNKNLIKQITLIIIGLVCVLLINFKKNSYSFQDIFVYTLGLDGISLLFSVMDLLIFIWNENLLWEKYSIAYIVLNLLVLFIYFC